MPTEHIDTGEDRKRFLFWAAVAGGLWLLVLGVIVVWIVHALA